MTKVRLTRITGNVRAVNTSPIKKIEQQDFNTYIFTTQSGSKYMVEILSGEENIEYN